MVELSFQKQKLSLKLLFYLSGALTVWVLSKFITNYFRFWRIYTETNFIEVNFFWFVFQSQSLIVFSRNMKYSPILKRLQHFCQWPLHFFKVAWIHKNKYLLQGYHLYKEFSIIFFMNFVTSCNTSFLDNPNLYFSIFKIFSASCFSSWSGVAMFLPNDFYFIPHFFFNGPLFCLMLRCIFLLVQ